MVAGIRRRGVSKFHPRGNGPALVAGALSSFVWEAPIAIADNAALRRKRCRAPNAKDVVAFRVSAPA